MTFALLSSETKLFAGLKSRCARIMSSFWPVRSKRRKHRRKAFVRKFSAASWHFDIFALDLGKNSQYYIFQWDSHGDYRQNWVGGERPGSLRTNIHRIPLAIWGWYKRQHLAKGHLVGPAPRVRIPGHVEHRYWKISKSVHLAQQWNNFVCVVVDSVASTIQSKLWRLPT